MKIAVIGSGYVGLVTGTCFADLGNRVICVDMDREKIRLLKRGRSPIYEPSLEELIQKNQEKKRLFFTTNLPEAIQKSDILFITVGTPPKPNGDADLSYVENAAKVIARESKGYKLIVEKSTVPVQTGQWIRQTIRRYRRPGVSFDVASNPEFLREGTAVRDFMKPDRVVLGVESARAKKLLSDLYEPFETEILFTDIQSAELIKHASNSFLATKISFINSIARLCDLVGADVELVAKGMGLDQRIGKNFLKAGVGFGGFCFPKDLAAFYRLSEKMGYPFSLLREVVKINNEQREYFVQKIVKSLSPLKGKTLAVLGLSFKPNTDDMRFAPSLEIIPALVRQGARVKAFDPHAMPAARRLLKGITFAKDVYEAAEGSDALIILTEWNEFKEIDLLEIRKKLKHPIIIDGRNIYEPKRVKRLGFDYTGIGRR